MKDINRLKRILSIIKENPLGMIVPICVIPAIIHASWITMYDKKRMILDILKRHVYIYIYIHIIISINSLLSFNNFSYIMFCCSEVRFYLP
jgi:hypothetical protein